MDVNRDRHLNLVMGTPHYSQANLTQNYAPTMLYFASVFPVLFYILINIVIFLKWNWIWGVFYNQFEQNFGIACVLLDTLTMFQYSLFKGK